MATSIEPTGYGTIAPKEKKFDPNAALELPHASEPNTAPNPS
jgi:hypothetical protein